MKHEKRFTGLVSALLSYLLSFGAVACLVTGFQLPVESMFALGFACLLFGSICTVCFLHKRGWVLILCSTALLLLILWRSYDALEQCLALISRITDLYHRVYGWPALRFDIRPWQQVPAEFPVTVLGCLIAQTVAWTLCRRKSAWLAVTASLFPLILCLITIDTVPNELCLFFLLFGLILLVMTNTVRRKDPAQGNRLTGMVALPTLIGLLLVFLLIPQDRYVNRVESFQDQILAMVEEVLNPNINNPGTDIDTGNVDLRSVGPHTFSTVSVLEVTAPMDGVIYLREQDYNNYDGNGWTASLHRTEHFPSNALTTELVPEGRVTVEPRRARERMLLPYYPDKAELVGGRIKNAEGLTRYEYTKQALPDDWREALDHTDISYEQSDLLRATGSQLYRTLPYSTREWATALVNSILTDKTSATAMAEQIGDYVRNSARYDLNTLKMPADQTDFARWFLEESDTGYCVHFATASVVLMRAAGLEARYVTGYMVSAKAGAATTVQAGHAHAWAEYFEPRLGLWMVLESTPADSLDPQTAHNTSSQSENETSSTPLESIKKTDTPQKQGTVIPDGARKVINSLLCILIIVAVTILQRHIRLRLRRRKFECATPNELALLYWREVVLASRLQKLQPPQSLKSLAEKAKFSQHTLTGEELQKFADHLQKINQELKTQPWYAKLVYRYIFART